MAKRMTKDKAWDILSDFNSSKFSEADRKNAINELFNAVTLFDITKLDLINVIRYLGEKLYNPWTSINKRSPRRGEFVLVSFRDSSVVDLAYYDVNNGRGTFYDSADESYTSRNMVVSAWMPLPENYGGQKMFGGD